MEDNFSYWLSLQEDTQRVKFGSADLRSIQAAINKYLKYITSFIDQCNSKLKNRPSQNMLDAWMKELGSWVGRINEMLSSLPQKDVQKEWTITEATRINYKKFEEMASTMKHLVDALNTWVKGLMKANPAQSNAIRNFYVKQVAIRSSELAQKFVWLNNKIKELMSIHGRPYQGLENRPETPAQKVGYRRIVGQQPSMIQR